MSQADGNADGDHVCLANAHMPLAIQNRTRRGSVTRLQRVKRKVGVSLPALGDLKGIGWVLAFAKGEEPGEKSSVRD